MSVASPTVKVLVRFDAGAENAGWLLGEGGLGAVAIGTPTADSDFDNVSADVRSVSVDRGKSRELQQYQPGRADVVLDNSTRKYDPLNAAGTYYGKILPGRQVRIKMTHPTTSTEYTVFSGNASDWGVGYTSMKDSTVTLRCTDRMTDLSRADIIKTSPAGTSKAAADAILDASGIVSRDISTGSGTMQETDFTGTGLGAMQLLEASEQGVFYADKTNQVVFKGRHDIYTDAASNTSQATFGPAALPLTNVALDFDSDLVRNEISLTRAGGAAQTATDTTAITAYGKRGYKLSNLMTSTNAAVAALATVILSLYKDPVVRVRRITLQPRTNAALMTEALNRSLRDRVTVQFSPPGGGSAITKTGFITGIHHRLTPQQMTTMFDLESTEGFDVAFVLGIGELGTATLWA